MTDGEIIGKVHTAIYQQCQKRGYAAPVDVLIDIGILEKAKYESWRFGRISYLESICNTNLRNLSFIMHQIRLYAIKNKLKPSETVYKQWGVKKFNGQESGQVVRLRFSKSGAPEIEKWYSTHFIDTIKINQLNRNNIKIAPAVFSYAFLLKGGSTRYG